MLMLKNKKNIRKNYNLKKSQILLFGSLLIFIGFCILTGNIFKELKDEVYSDMLISLSDVDNKEKKEDIKDVPITTNVTTPTETVKEPPKPVDFSKYLGVLEIPKIYLKRGFYGTDSKYNDIKYNVTLMKGADLPNVVNGNLILVAHSGTAYISYFKNLYRLKVGDPCYVTYNGVKYTYIIKNIYNVDKTGAVPIIRDKSKTSLTLITCTKDDLTKQTVYIAELT